MTGRLLGNRGDSVEQIGLEGLMKVSGGQRNKKQDTVKCDGCVGHLVLHASAAWY